MVDRKTIPSIYSKQITHLQSGNQTYMELRNGTVGLHQQVEHRHHAEIPIQNSQSHTKCTMLFDKSFSTYRLKHLLRNWRHPRKNHIHHNNLEANPNPLSEPLLQTIKSRRLKRCWPFDLQGTWSDVAGWIPYHVIVIHYIVAYFV